MAGLPLILLLLGDPTVDQIVEHAISVMDRNPAHMTCQLEVDIQSFDKKGAPEDHYLIRQLEKRTGEKVDHELVAVWKNGKDITAEKKKEKKDDKKDKDEDLLEPFTRKGFSHYRYQLLRRDSLWGRPAFVVQVAARDPQPTAGNGTAWIDAETFVELKGEYTPAKMPDEHVDWLKFQTQYVIHRNGFVIPSFFKIEGAGHFLLMRKGFRSTMRWTDCQ